MIPTTEPSATLSGKPTHLSLASFGTGNEKDSLLAIWNPKKNSVADTLASEPQAFDFFQAVLLLEQISARGDANVQGVSSKPIGRFHRLDQESVRIAAPATSAFPTAQIEALTIDEKQQPRMLVNFMGLTGPSGMLPRTYTQLLSQTNRDGRGEERYALRDFLDQFNHRLISLFFVAWTKYRFPVQILRSEGRSSLFEVVLSACGGLTAPESVDDRLTQSQVSRDDLLAFAGLLSQHPATAANLQSVLNRILNLPVRVLQFQASVLELDESSQTCLGVENGCGQLGLSAVVGPRTRTRQHKIGIEIGPIEFDRLVDFLPGEETDNGYGQIAELVRQFAGHSMEYELQLRVRSYGVVGCRLESLGQAEEANNAASYLGSRLGFDSWLQSDTKPQILEDAVIPGQNTL